MILNSFYALLSSLSFGILFNIRGKNLFIASIGAGIAWFFLLLFEHNFGFSTTFSLFIASIIIGVYSEIMARLLKSPVTIFAVCAIIPLVPGNGMYYTMYQSVNGNAAKALSTGIQTFASAGAIAAGILLISSATKLINIMKKSS